MRERMLWVALGLVSLVLAAALGLATSKLTDAPVGLSAEPVSAGEALAPSPMATPKPAATQAPRKRRRPRRTPTATPAPTAVPTAVPTADDNSGHGSDDSGGDDSSGRGRGRSGDDD
ncbi:MAG TPA: hypothetical protein VK631_00820 [Solirubrobacteraceae bacterium]|nr:hypothetical protein [Solirubrobacteraceae bacterium]